MVMLAVCKTLATRQRNSSPHQSYVAAKAYKLISIVYYLQERGLMHRPNSMIANIPHDQILFAQSIGITKPDYEDMRRDFYNPYASDEPIDLEDNPALGKEPDLQAEPLLTYQLGVGWQSGQLHNPAHDTKFHISTYTVDEYLAQKADPNLRRYVKRPEISEDKNRTSYPYGCSVQSFSQSQYPPGPSTGVFVPGTSKIAQIVRKHDYKYGHDGCRDLRTIYRTTSIYAATDIEMDAEATSIIKCCYLAGLTGCYGVGIRLLRVLARGYVSFPTPRAYDEILSFTGKLPTLSLGPLVACIEFWIGVLRSRTAEGDRLFAALESDFQVRTHDGENFILFYENAPEKDTIYKGGRGGRTVSYNVFRNCVIIAAIVAADRADMVHYMTKRGESLQKWLPWVFANASYGIIKNLAAPMAMPRILGNVLPEVIYGLPQNRNFISSYCKVKLAPVPGSETCESLMKMWIDGTSNPLEHGTKIRLDDHDIRRHMRETFSVYTQEQRVTFLEHVLIRLEANAVSIVPNLELHSRCTKLIIKACQTYDIRINVVYWLYLLLICPNGCILLRVMKRMNYKIFDANSREQIAEELKTNSIKARLIGITHGDLPRLNEKLVILTPHEIIPMLRGVGTKYQEPKLPGNHRYAPCYMPWRFDLGSESFRVQRFKV